MKTISLIFVLLTGVAGAAEPSSVALGTGVRLAKTFPVGGVDPAGDIDFARGSADDICVACQVSLQNRIAETKSTNDSGEVSFVTASQTSPCSHAEMNLLVASLGPIESKPAREDRANVALRSRRAALTNAPCPSSNESQVSSAIVLSGSAQMALATDQYHVSLVSFGGAAASSFYLQAARAVMTNSIATLSPTGPWTERYEYDAAGRLRKVTFADGAITDYALDNAGNRTTVSTTVP